MKDTICREAQYIIEHNSTVRAASQEFGRSKSTIHIDMRQKLPHIHHGLAVEVAKVLDTNRTERAMRGGLALKAKREKMRRN